MGAEAGQRRLCQIRAGPNCPVLDVVVENEHDLRGPLTYLARMTADDPRILQEWACDGLRDEQVGRIEATVDHLLHQQGHAAAATWAVAVRPRTYLDAEVLGDRLLAAWEYNLGSIRAKDVAKSVRRWNR